MKYPALTGSCLTLLYAHQLYLHRTLFFPENFAEKTAANFAAELQSYCSLSLFLGVSWIIKVAAVDATPKMVR